ncbi:ArsR/SmtB family transcription factor [Loktanella agnita]|uniref:ArsR/SmtB family transcription factor n=1 Tax=Loktanella agnita TaxID=287097 RepID=UPI0039884B5D
MTEAEQMGFRALADPTRRNILRLLADADMTIGEVAENFDMTRAAVKKHLSILSAGDLITVQTHGRSRVNALNPDGLRQLFDWFSYFDAFWDVRLTKLKSEIEKDLQ